jgi:TP901 family phage tail tape measure protein/lambda family phage tail tape measure protein
MSRMSLDTAIRLSAEVKGGGAIDRVKRSLQDFGKTGQTSKRDLDQLRAATFQFSRANDQTIAGIRNSISAFRGLQEQAKIGGREFRRYGEEIKRLEGKLTGLDGAATKAGANLGQKLATGLAAAGVGRALKGITMQAANFDAELRKAAAIEGGAGSFDVLRKEIEAVAAVAAGTPTEVAALATALSRAGFSAEQTTKALRGIVLGAEATDTAFDQMGGIVGTILKTFQMDASQTGTVVDILVKSANSADQTITDVGEAMAYAAGQASSLGVSVEDSSALIALFADASVRGSRAGTALATGLNRLQIAAGGGDSELQDLTRGSAKMIDAMARLGASVLDAEGKLKPLDQVLIAIKRQMDQFGPTDRAIIAKALFGEESGRSFQAVLQRSEQDIVKMFRATNDAGGTAEQTRDKMRGFSDSVKILDGNFQNLTNQIGGVIGEALRPLIDALNNAIGATQKWPEPLRQAGAAAAAAGLSVLGLVAAIAALKLSLGVIGSIKLATSALKLFAGSATGAGVASGAAAVNAGKLLGVLTTLGKIGIIAIGVKFAIEGLDELITGLVGVRDADAAARAMAERRGLTYSPSAAVQRRSVVQTGDLVRTPASGRTFTVAGVTYDSNGVPVSSSSGTLPPSEVLVGGGAAAAGSRSGGGRSSADKQPSIEERIAARPFGREIIAAAKANNVDAALFAALVEQESGNRQSAISRSGAIGLAQLMPDTARELGVNPNDPMQNLMGGARYLRQQLDRFGLEGGLRAYNQGPGAQQRTPGGNSQQSIAYPGLVLDRYRNLVGADGNLEDLRAQGFQSQQQQMEQRLGSLNDLANTAERSRQETELQLIAMQQINAIARQIVEADNEAFRITQAYADQKAKIEESAQGAATAAENQAKADALSAIEADKKLKLELNAAKLSEQLSNDAAGLTSDLEQAAKEAGDRLAFEREYAALLKSGMNPELARQSLEIDKIVNATKTNLNQRIRILEAAAAQLDAESEIRKELEKQIALLNQTSSAVDATADKTKSDIAATVNKTEGEKIESRIQVLKDELKEITSLSGQAEFAAQAIGDAFSSSFKSVLDGTKSAKAALSDFFRSLSERYLEMAVEIIAKQLQMITLQTIFNQIGGLFGGGAAVAPAIAAPAAAVPTAAIGFANGGVFAENSIVPYASGGIVDKPTLFKFANGGKTKTGLMGEAGPEAILPLRRNASGALGVIATGAGGGSNSIVNQVTVNVDAKGSNVAGDDKDSRKLGAVVADAVQAELVKQQRPGGILDRNRTKSG